MCHELCRQLCAYQRDIIVGETEIEAQRIEQCAYISERYKVGIAGCKEHGECLGLETEYNRAKHNNDQYHPEEHLAQNLKMPSE